MDILINFLTDPKIISLLTVPIIAMVAEAYVIVKLFKKYTELQEDRFKEAIEMNKEYIHLSNEINKTLDLVVKLNSRSNGGSKDGHKE